MPRFGYTSNKSGDIIYITLFSFFFSFISVEPAGFRFGDSTPVDQNPVVQSGSTFSKNPAYNGPVVTPVPCSTGRTERVDSGFKTSDKSKIPDSDLSKQLLSLYNFKIL